jgi:hypothetical protein
MLLLYILLLGLLAAFTAYTRHFQSTVIAIEQQIPGGPGIVATPKQQTMRTALLVLGWPAALGIGMLFIAWWKAAALVVGAFLLLVPLIGSFLPRPTSAHYVNRIRADLERRVALGGRDAGQLRHILAQLDQITRQGPT